MKIHCANIMAAVLNKTIYPGTANDEKDEHNNEETEIEGPLSEHNKELLKSVECPVCLKGMVWKIYLCELGHSMCYKCRADFNECPSCGRKMTNRRNEVMEEISDFVFYPCSYTKCPKFIKKQYLNSHYINCNYKIITCMLDDRCKGTYPRIKMKEHVLKYHARQVWVNDANFDIWKDSIKRNIQAVIAHDKLFYIHMKRVDDSNDPNLSLIYWGLQYIGPPKDVKKYKFEMSIFGSFDSRKIKVTEDCHDDTITFNQIIRTGRCVSIRVDKMKTYYNQYNKCVYYTIKVIKLHN